MASCLQFRLTMKQENFSRAILKMSMVVAFYLTLLPVLLFAVPVPTQNQNQQGNLSARDKQVAAGFEARVKQYVKLREGLEDKLPKLSQDATPEQIEKHKIAFQEVVRSARSGAKQGTIFTPEAAKYIRATIKREFRGAERQELRKTVLSEATRRPYLCGSITPTRRAKNCWRCRPRCC